MVIITENMFPPGSAKDIGKTFLELPPLPEYITMKGPYIHSDTKRGIRSILIYECDNSKLADALQVVGDRVTNYFDVPGYTYSVNAWYEAQEALKMIGLA
ncbi:MAG: hypothetical protein JSV31_14290 [Desulfobacterales bacterium]|nr:MAG: hypothetical protein JSV31_14290 [Desulfobacterales bacterium]